MTGNRWECQRILVLCVCVWCVWCVWCVCVCVWCVCVCVCVCVSVWGPAPSWVKLTFGARCRNCQHVSRSHVAQNHDEQKSVLTWLVPPGSSSSRPSSDEADKNTLNKIPHSTHSSESGGAALRVPPVSIQPKESRRMQKYPETSRTGSSDNEHARLLRKGVVCDESGWANEQHFFCHFTIFTVLIFVFLPWNGFKLNQFKTCFPHKDKRYVIIPILYARAMLTYILHEDFEEHFWVTPNTYLWIKVWIFSLKWTIWTDSRSWK